MLFFGGIAVSGDFEVFDLKLNQAESIEEKQMLFDQTVSQLNSWTANDQGRYYHSKGLFVESQGEIEQAKALFNQSIAVFEQQNIPNEYWVLSLQDRSYMDYLLTNDTAIYCADRKEALNIARRQESATALTGALTSYVFCMKDGFDGFEPGLALLTEAAQVAKENKLSQKHSAMIHNATGLLYRSNQLHDKAYEYLSKAYDDWVELNDIQDMFNMQHSLVGESIKLNLWDQADLHIKILYQLAKNNPDFKDFTFFAHYNHGRKLFAEGLFLDAVQVFNQALAIKDSTKEQYFVDTAEAMWLVAKYRSGNEQPLEGMFSDPELLIGKLKGEIKKELQAVLLASKGEYNEALIELWQLSDQKEKDKLSFTKNNTAFLSMTFDNEIHALQKQALQDQIGIKDLELAREASNNKLIKYTRTIALLAVALFGILLYFLYKSRTFYRAKSRTDFMTGLSNRRSSLAQASKILFQAEKMQHNVGLVIFDIDDFKQVNDEYGHIVGDKVIKAVATAAQAIIKEGMVLGRIGGEEFILVLPECDRAQLSKVAEDIRINVSKVSTVTEGVEIKKTISLGVALHCSPGKTTVQDLMKKADMALYQAKNNGKNQSSWHKNQ